MTGDRGDHSLLDRPRNTPTRTGIGAAGIAFYCALWGAGSADLAATQFHLQLEAVVGFYQVTVLIGPVFTFMIARRVCFALQRKDREILLHGYETGRIVRMPGGEYIEIHAPVAASERWRLVNSSDYKPLRVHPDERGHLGALERARERISRSFFEDRISPVVSSTLARIGDNDVDEERADAESFQAVS